MSNSRRVWLFRGLVMGATGLLLLSWFMPWWTANIEGFSVENPIVIHPWALEKSTSLIGVVLSFIVGSDMPGYFAPLMWSYLGLAITALVIGAWIKDKSVGLFGRKLNLSRWIIGVVGFSYIVIVVLAVVVAAIRTGDYGGMHLLGRTLVEIAAGEAGWVEGHLEIGYWLACGAGLLLVVLALLRNKIVGKPVVNA